MSDADESFLMAYSPDVQAIALQLRALIQAVIPAAIEQVDPPSKIIAYGHHQTYAGLICATAPYKSYVNLMFSHGTELADPDGLLEGTGKRARHVRIVTASELANPAVRRLLEAAACRVAGVTRVAR
jgi:hypothetical protein